MGYLGRDLDGGRLEISSCYWRAGYIGSATSWAKAPGSTVFDPVDDLLSLPLNNLPRDISGLYGTELWWLGRLVNGTMIRPGRAGFWDAGN